MKIHLFFSEYFDTDQVPTERKVFELLKESPLSTDIDYVAIPWAVVINDGLQKKLPDLKLKNAFTICQHIRYLELFPYFSKCGISTVFTPHASFPTYHPEVFPFPHLAVHGTSPAQKKDVWYSFVGAETTSGTFDVRKEIFSMPHPKESIVIRRQHWHWAGVYGWGPDSPDVRRKEKAEYQDLLARSRFSLCPKGTGPSTIRFWESLEAGAIPILLSDFMWLPDGFDWSRCVVRIPERGVRELSKVIQSISPDKEAEMRENCRAAYREFSGKSLVSSIRRHYR